MPGERLFCFPGMPVVWRVMLLWVCVFIWLPAQAQGALVVSRRDALTQDTKDTVGIKTMKKRSTNSPNMVEVYSVTVDCTVMSRFAHTVMTSKAVNKAKSSQEIFFEVELPKTAFITNFSIETEAQVYVGEVKKKEKAKKEYAKAVSSGQTAGLVKASGRTMEKFSMSFNIAAKSNVTFILTYEELLQRKLGRYEILTRVKPKQPVQEFQIVADIYEPQGIAFVEATATFLPNELLSLVEKTVTDAKAHISFSPILEQQRKCPGCQSSIIDGDFIIKYDVKREEQLGEVQERINEWKKDCTATNINDAVLRAVSMLVTERKDKNLPERSTDMIILLTDGMPNTGESDLPMIQENVRSAIGGNMSLFCLGLGNDVDYSFLDVLCRQNKGLARRIFEGSDAAFQLQGFYEEVSSPLLLEVDLSYPDNAVDFLTKNHYSQLFNGSEIVVSGRLADSNMDNFLVEVFAQGPEEDFWVQGKASVVNLGVIYPEQEYIFGDFSERLWAYLTIQQLLENSDIGTQQEKHDTTAKALDMSLRYSFVTPVTSMVVTKPEDGPDSLLIADKLTEDQRQEAERRSGSSGRGSSFHSQSNVDGDPHFMIEFPDRDDALCFTINDKPGTIFNLVRDPKSGFVVNGQIIGKKKVVSDGNTHTYFGRFGIVHQKLGVRLEVSTQDISVFHVGKQVKLLWSDTASIKETNMDFRLTKNCSLTVTLRQSVKFMVIRHSKVWKRRQEQQDYLGFYTLDSHHLSASVHGLLGQFYHGVEFEVADLRPGEVQENLDATMYVKGQTFNVTRHWQKDFSWHVKNGENIPCWFVTNDGKGLIDGKASDYIVSGIFKTAF
ncbi:inter-alpha-trypsin inhibitor heavy chain H3-like [Siniperca chuatsi]|uniref:inter-alpha-trypsin inhibitor heavy chain H3-like n=1 Tax=Siniperca chuatsi TaxID=119488 RepID=UPI001CE06CF2|nr:inter-alpha-trypsin inhibitor heavy chain H3-like [Siniperca chuatsi]